MFIFRATRACVQSILVSFFVLLTVLWADQLPGENIQMKLESELLKKKYMLKSILGHTNGKFVPIYIPEHYGPRNSQHLSDPYT